MNNPIPLAIPMHVFDFESMQDADTQINPYRKLKATLNIYAAATMQICFADMTHPRQQHPNHKPK